MSTQIDSLDIQIKTSAGQSVENIEKLAAALERLKEGAKLGQTAKNLEKLSKALDGLQSKSGGVANLSRLSEKMQSVSSATFRVATASQDAKKGFDMSSMGLMALISNYGTLITTVNQVIQVMSNALAQAIEWDGIQFRFGRAFGEDAEETYNYILKINEALGINIQEFMQYSSLYGSLLSGFGMAQEKVTAISVGLTELSYDIWAAYNDRFKTLESASEAVRSAITGEIEPIRNAGIALTEASLQEFIDQTHLAGVSIEKLTEAQKSEVRYAAMVNAAMSQGIVGTYAREMNTAEGAIRSLSQSFKGLVQALGSLFIPLLQVIVPYVTAFVELITEAVFWLASLFGIKIQPIDWSSSSKGIGGMAEGAKDTASGLDDAAKAAKKLKSYTMGFDELNVINPDTGSAGGSGGIGGAGGSGWGEGLDLESLWDDSIFAEASKRVDEIKAKIKGFLEEWGWLIGLVGAALTGLMIHKAWPTIAAWGAQIAKVFFGITNTIRAVWGAFKGSAAAESALAMMSPKLSAFVASIKAAWAAFKALGALNIAGWAAAVAAVIATVVSVVYFLYKNWDEVTESVKKFFRENIAPKLEEIGNHFSDLKEALGPVGDLFKRVYDAAKEFVENLNWKNLGVMVELVGGLIYSVVGGVIATAFNMLVGMIENAIQMFTGLTQIVSGAIQVLIAIFNGDFMLLIEATRLVTEGINNLFGGMAGFVIDTVTNLINGIVSWFLSLPGEILEPVRVFTEDVFTIFKVLWENVQAWWAENVQPKFTSEYWLNKFNVIKTAIRTKLDEFKASVIEKWNGIQSWYKTNVAPKFTKEFWVSKLSGFKEGFVEVIKNAMNSGIDRINNFIDRVNSALHISWDGFEFMGQEIFPSGSFQLATIPKISRFENGGFIEDGLFTMNRGEIAGKFNNGKSVVANNEQIIAGISEGVYSAVIAAMSETQRGNSGDQPVVVYLDGKQIYSSVKRAESRRGMDLMGNQLGYVY